MNKLSTAARVQVIAALVEGSSINATVRMTGISKRKILKLLCDLGEACKKLHDEKVRNLTCARVQCDEIWAFCHSKQKNVAPENKGVLGYGDIWTYTGIDADTKLMVAWSVGFREASWANAFMADVADRLTSRVQLTTDGLKVYLKAVANAFGDDVDYMQLIKIYGPDRSSPVRYSPPECIGVETHEISGKPDRAHCSTSFVERANLTMRMGMRRFTRLTNGFSKKADNHKHMVSLFFTYYNFCRVHMTLKTTPAVAAGITDRVWTIEDLAIVLEAQEHQAGVGTRPKSACTFATRNSTPARARLMAMVMSTARYGKKATAAPSQKSAWKPTCWALTSR